MDILEQHVYLNIHEIVEKLHKLDCTLLGNKDDAWIMELLFKPGFHRCNLIEWILSKFGYDVELKNSAESRIKNLKSTLLDWGICRENIDSIIKGTAAVKEQFIFWNSLVDKLWTKYEITSSISVSDSFDRLSLSPKKYISKNIFCEFEETCSSIHKLLESDNLQHLFKSDIQVLAPDVESEIKNLSTSKLEIFGTSNIQKSTEIDKENDKPNMDKLTIYEKLCDSKLEIEDNQNGFESERNKLIEEMRKISTDLQNIEGAFNDVYEDLQPLILNAKADDFVDVGSAFQKIEPPVKDFLELNKSIPKLEASSLTFSQDNSELKDLLNQNILADENYTNVFKLLKEMNQ